MYETFFSEEQQDWRDFDWEPFRGSGWMCLHTGLRLVLLP